MLDKLLKNISWSDKKAEYITSTNILVIGGVDYYVEEKRRFTGWLIRKTRAIGESLFNNGYIVDGDSRDSYMRKKRKASSLDQKGIETFLPINEDAAEIEGILSDIKKGDIWVTRYVPGLQTVSTYLMSEVPDEKKYILARNLGAMLGEMHSKDETIDDPSCVNIAVSLGDISKLYVGPFDLKSDPDMPLPEKKARELVMLATNVVHWSNYISPKLTRKEFFEGYFSKVKASSIEMEAAEDAGKFHFGKDFGVKEYLAVMLYPFARLAYNTLAVGDYGSIRKTREYLKEHMKVKC